MSTSQYSKVQDLPGSLGTLRSRAAVEAYIEACLRKVEIAYGPSLILPNGGFIPYETFDTHTKRRVEEYLSSVSEWQKISLSELRQSFADDYWSIFHHIGWEGTYRLTPAIIKLAYEGYLQSDEIVSTVENLFSKFPRFSEDQSSNFLEWIGMYDKYQIVCIIDMITLFSDDPLSLFPDGFTEGKRWWMRYYVDG
jgi:hypothetical protein